jgi:hypothetical protein
MRCGDIVDGGRVTTIQQRTGAHRQHEGLRGARAGAPGDRLAERAGFRARTGGAHEGEDGLDHRLADRQAAHQALGGGEVLRGHHRARFGLLGAGGVEQDLPLGVAVGIVDVDLHQESVELGFGQWVGAFLLQRVLRRQHMERLGQVMAHAGDGDVALLHGLQQGRLGAW